MPNDIPKEVLKRIEEFAIKESCSPSDAYHINKQVLYGYYIGFYEQSLLMGEVRELLEILESYMKDRSDAGDLNEEGGLIPNKEMVLLGEIQAVISKIK